MEIEVSKSQWVPDTALVTGHNIGGQSPSRHTRRPRQPPAAEPERSRPFDNVAVVVRLPTISNTKLLHDSKRLVLLRCSYWSAKTRHDTVRPEVQCG